MEHNLIFIIEKGVNLSPLKLFPLHLVMGEIDNQHASS